MNYFLLQLKVVELLASRKLGFAGMLTVERVISTHLNPAEPSSRNGNGRADLSSTIPPEGIDGRVVLAVREMIEQDYTNGAKNHDYPSYRDLATKVARFSFRNHGLSTDLNMRFGGDIPLAIRTAIPVTRQKQLLHLDQVDPLDPVKEEWRQREKEIEETIAQGQMHMKRELLVGTGGEPVINRKRFRQNSRRKIRWYSTIDKAAKKRPSKEITHEETEDVINVIGQFVHPGETVCKLMGSYEVYDLDLMTRRVGKEGKVYLVTSAPNLEQELFKNLFDLYVGASGLKGEGLRQLPSYGEYSNRLASEMAGFMALPYLADLEFYENGYSDEDVANIRAAFFERFPVTPINASIPPFPGEVRSGSVDVVTEMERFSRVPEDKKEEFIYEIDRLLKPGGRMLIREGSRQQATFEYYGKQLLEDHYERREPKWLRQGARWMIYSKRGLSKPVDQPYEVDGVWADLQLVKTVATESQPKQATKEQMLLEVRLALRDISEGRTEETGGQLSLSWFRKKGLLPVFMKDFSGNMKEVIEEASKVNTSRASTNTSGDARPSYGLSDLSEETGISQGEVRRAIGQLNIKGLQTGRRTQGRGQNPTNNLRFSQQEYTIIANFIKSQRR